MHRRVSKQKQNRNTVMWFCSPLSGYVFMDLEATFGNPPIGIPEFFPLLSH